MSTWDNPRSPRDPVAQITLWTMAQLPRLCLSLPRQGTIDQVDGLIAFDRESERLLQWDAQIQGMCQTLNDILDGAAARGLTVSG